MADTMNEIKAVTGGTVEKPKAVLTKCQKGWGKVRSVTGGTYTVQIVMPGGAVETLAVVDAAVGKGQEARIDARVYVNVVDVAKDAEKEV